MKELFHTGLDNVMSTIKDSSDEVKIIGIIGITLITCTAIAAKALK